MNIVFLDLETTGLSPTQDEILEIAILDEHETVLFESLIKPTHIETAHPKALQVNGYAEHPERWDTAPTWVEVAPTVMDLLAGKVLGGHNINRFDLNFVKHHLQLAGQDISRLSGETVDTLHLAKERLLHRGLTSKKLHTVCEYLGVSNEGEHTAAADTRRTIRAYHSMVAKKQSLWSLRDCPLGEWLKVPEFPAMVCFFGMNHFGVAKITDKGVWHGAVIGGGLSGFDQVSFDTVRGSGSEIRYSLEKSAKFERAL